MEFGTFFPYYWEFHHPLPDEINHFFGGLNHQADHHAHHGRYAGKLLLPFVEEFLKVVSEARRLDLDVGLGVSSLSKM